MANAMGKLGRRDGTGLNRMTKCGPRPSQKRWEKMLGTDTV